MQIPVLCLVRTTSAWSQCHSMGMTRARYLSTLGTLCHLKNFFASTTTMTDRSSSNTLDHFRLVPIVFWFSTIVYIPKILLTAIIVSRSNEILSLYHCKDNLIYRNRCPITTKDTIRRCIMRSRSPSSLNPQLTAVHGCAMHQLPERTESITIHG